MIVIPMAGLSSRFFKAGYTKPKYMLEINDRPLFDYVVLSFKRYFGTLPFRFIVRSDYDTPSFVKERCKALGINDFSVVILDKETRGQAETVALGLKAVPGNIPITIFNIDTIRPNFEFPEQAYNADGYLEVFRGSGTNWSYAKPVSENSYRVTSTAEKDPISDLCSTGLYHFNQASYFLKAFNEEAELPSNQWSKGELYIAPLYNRVIADKKEINYHLIDSDNVIFCGIPEEYETIVKKGELSKLMQ